VCPQFLNDAFGIAGCQVFHRCSDDPWYTGQVRVTMDSFLCPNGSLFNQQVRELLITSRLLRNQESFLML